MTRATLATIVLTVITLATGAQAPRDPDAASRFEAVHVYIDPGGAPLAAWQIELHATAGDVRIAGIEGGDHPVYSEPPYYDPEAMEGERVIIADFATRQGWELPAGRTRIATVHVQVRGGVEPEYAIELQAAAGVDAEPIEATIDLETERP